MKRTLIVYNYYNHHLMMEYFVDLIKKHGYEVDLLCTANLKFICKSSISLPKAINMFISIVSSSLKYFPFSISSSLCQIFFSRILFILILKRYNYVDFHSIPPLIDPMASLCIKKRVSFDMTFWGSDIIHANEERIKKMKFMLDSCEHLKCTKNLYDIVVEKYGDIYDEKYKEAYLGNIGLEYLNQISDVEITTLTRTILCDGIDDKIVITCGYNGIEVQDHLFMIETLRQLPEYLKKKIFVVFPMTYGKNAEYYNKVKFALSQSGLYYKILENYLDPKALAAFRYTSDIMIMAQRTDAFSGSVQEHIYCKNIVLIGDWLDYPLLKKSDIYYIVFSHKTLLDVLLDVLDNYDYYKEKCSQNTDKMYSLMSWGSRLGDWLPTYMEN